MNTNKFSIDIVGDLEYEDLIADIYYGGEFIAMISQENGFENLHIEITSRPDGKNWHFSYREFEKALQHAQKALYELRKSEEND